MDLPWAERSAFRWSKTTAKNRLGSWMDNNELSRSNSARIAVLRYRSARSLQTRWTSSATNSSGSIIPDRYQKDWLLSCYRRCPRPCRQTYLYGRSRLPYAIYLIANRHLLSRDNYYTPTKAYTALRIPQIGENTKLKRLILSGAIDFAAARKLETACLAVVFAYDQGNVDVDEALEILTSYEKLWRGNVVSIDRIRETLVDTPWRTCRCQVCRELGINVVIFRGAERNRRRGFHNLYVLHEMLSSI